VSLAPLHACAEPGCPALVRGSSRCPRHAPRPDEKRGTPVERGYDIHHKRLRLLCFERDGWRCVDCGFIPDIVDLYRRLNLGMPAQEKILKELRVRCNNGDRHLHADHIVPIAEQPGLRLELSNLATRCDQCHRVRTMRQQLSQRKDAYAHA
jgi:5-methylcytosine-specific restriction endonuclease McrA